MHGRRHFSLASLGLALPAIARAATTRRVGWLSAQTEASLAPYLPALRQGLADQGLVPGQGFELQALFGDNDVSRVPALARQLVDAGFEAIIVQGAAVPEVAKLALPVPVVFITSADPIAGGLARSLAEPNGNMTGVTFMAFELHAKRLELLRAMMPSLRSVTVLGNPRHAGADLEHAANVTAGKTLGITADFAPAANPAELEQTLQQVARARPDAISLLPDGVSIAYRARIMEFSAAERIPVISGWRLFAQSGAICTYGPQLEAVYRRVGSFVSRILAGARASSLPIERPTQFELILNRRVAARFGLEFPKVMLARADAFIE